MNKILSKQFLKFIIPVASLSIIALIWATCMMAMFTGNGIAVINFNRYGEGFIEALFVLPLLMVLNIWLIGQCD